MLKQGYKSWKGFSVPPTNKTDVIGTIRPLTNNDSSNSSETGFGLARPIKHARKGRDVTGRMNSVEFAYLIDAPDSSAITPNFFVDKEECKPIYKNTPEAKARRRSMYANTNLKSDYFNSLQACREKRCQTFDQRSFNFERNSSEAFYANCQPNKQGCKEVFYKPNNMSFAQQGAVSSSTRLIKLTNDTLNKTPVIAGKKNQQINYCIPVACSKYEYS
jgi:hypothetical protein